MDSAVSAYPAFNIATPMILNFLSTPSHGKHANWKPNYITQAWATLDMCAKLATHNGDGDDDTIKDLGEKYQTFIGSDLGKRIKSTYVNTSGHAYDPLPHTWDGTTPPPTSIYRICGDDSLDGKPSQVPHIYPNNFMLLGDMIYYNCWLKEVQLFKTTGVRKDLLNEDLINALNTLTCAPDWRQDARDIYLHGDFLAGTPDNPWLYSKSLLERQKAKDYETHKMIALIRGYNDSKTMPQYSTKYPTCMFCHQQ